MATKSDDERNSRLKRVALLVLILFWLALLFFRLR